MTANFPDQIDRIRARAAAATPGPWGWFGNTDVRHVYLATKHWGRHIIMNFRRWGTQAAEPVFFGDREVVAGESGRLSIKGGVEQTTRSTAIYEVAPHALTPDDPSVYRKDLIGIRNPDATFIAHSREDIDWLIKEHDRLTGLLTEGIHVDVPGIVAIRQVGWMCEHKYGTPSAGTHMSWNRKKGKLARDPNVSSSMQQLRYSNDSERCPEMVPIFAATPEESAATE